jgi:hypothetical protein
MGVELNLSHLKMFENGVMRIIRPKRVKMAGEWRRLHSEVLRNLYTSPNIIRIIKEDEIDRACSTHGRDKIVQNFGRKT